MGSLILYRSLESTLWSFEWYTPTVDSATMQRKDYIGTKEAASYEMKKSCKNNCQGFDDALSSNVLPRYDDLAQRKEDLEAN